MKSLNKRFRGKNFPTDVLSFPAARGLPANFKGEIAISVELAARNARRMGHSLAAEVKILTLHGVLHLAGYDHEQDDGAMARREQSLRKYFRLPIGLIERTGPDQHDGRETVKTRVETAGRKRFPPSVTRPVSERS
jgi:probable rRNA maturation factor